MNAQQIVLCIYMAGVVISMRVWVEKDPAKRTEHDTEISAVLSLGWPIVIIGMCCVAAYVLTHDRKKP